MAIATIDPQLDPAQGPRRGAYPIPLSSATTAGFLGRTERGPVNEPLVVETFAEYCRFFGGHLADGAVSRAVHDFFLHGGRRAVIVRVTNRARRARLDIPTDDDFLRLQARHPGRHEILRVSIDYEQVDADPYRFNLVVQRIGSSANRFIEDQELYPLISVRVGDARFSGDVIRQSRLIALAGPVPARRPLAMPPRRPGEPVRYVDMTLTGDDGAELTDYDIIGSDRDGTGLFAFDRGPRLNLLAVPLPPERELGTTAFVAATRYCEGRRALMIWDPPSSWRSVDAARIGSRRLDYASGNVLSYFPRIRPRGARARYAGGQPACGAIAGMLAQRDRRGVFGRDEDADYTLRVALTPVLAVSALEAQRLARCGLNPFVHATGGTTRLLGRVTLAKSSLDRKRLMFFILNSIEDALAVAIAEGDRSAALSRVEWQIRRFFGDLHAHGALKGRTPGQAFYLQTSGNGGGGQAGLCFGVALGAAGQFAEYAVTLDGEQAGKIHQLTGFEAEQHLS